MSDTFACGQTAALISYLYDEGERGEHAAIQAHVEVCPSCAAELMALEATRAQLASWTPPDATLGFSIAQPLPAAPRRPLSWLRQPMPAWAQVAAAGVIFAAGLSIGLARGGAPPVLAAATAAVADPEVPRVSTADLAALEMRLREDLGSLQPAASPLSVGVASEARLLARVRALIEESEARQRRELALRTAEIVRDFDSQRRVDLAQIQRTFGQIEGLTGAEVRQQRQMLNYLMQVSQQR